LQIDKSLRLFQVPVSAVQDGPLVLPFDAPGCASLKTDLTHAGDQSHCHI
jgi:hypothetical protein